MSLNDQMKADVFRALYLTEAGGELQECDAIECADRLWLIPEWKASPVASFRQPVRAIRLDTLPHSKAPAGSGADYVVDVPIPAGVMSGEASGLFEVVESPYFIWPWPEGRTVH